MITKLIASALAVALLVCIALAGMLWVKSGTIDQLRADKATLRLSLAGCTARAANQSEDKKSDAQIDNMPDLRVVPDEWLFVAPIGPGAGGLY